MSVSAPIQRLGIIINLADVTILKKLEDEAERKNRLTAMGQISMQVAHEIRNPLGSIELFISMMKKDFHENSNEMELMNHIISAIQSMNHIISNLFKNNAFWKMDLHNEVEKQKNTPANQNRN